MHFTDDFEHCPNLVPNTAYGIITHQDINTGLESLNEASSSGPPIVLQENNAYALEEPVNIQAKHNEAYAMGIITEQNEAYKPVTVVNECDNEYDYIF